MKTIKVRGMVLKEYETGEADKRLLLLCKDVGRIMVYARGARKPRSKFLAAAQIFTYSDFILTQGQGFYSLAQADVIENFYNLRTDYERLCAAHFIVDVCEKTLWENSDCDKLLLLVLKSLSNLSKEKFFPAQIKIVFLARFFDFYGLRPNTNFNPDAKIFFGAEGLCERGGIPFSQAAAAAFAFILNSETSQAFSFAAHENVLHELHNAVDFFWKHHF